MSQRSIEVVGHTYEAWNRGDYEAVFQAIDSEIQFELPAGGLNTGIYHGREDVRRLFESYLDAFEQVQFEPGDFFAKDDRVVVFVHQLARGKGSGVEVEIRLAHLWQIRDGKIVRFQVFPEREKALEAVGLSEQDAHWRTSPRGASEGWAVWSRSAQRNGGGR